MMVPTDVKWQTIERIIYIYISLYVHGDKKKQHMMDADCYEMANHISKYEMEFEIN